MSWRIPSTESGLWINRRDASGMRPLSENHSQHRVCPGSPDNVFGMIFPLSPKGDLTAKCGQTPVCTPVSPSCGRISSFPAATTPASPSTVSAMAFAGLSLTATGFASAPFPSKSAYGHPPVPCQRATPRRQPRRGHLERGAQQSWRPTCQDRSF